jgi:hypothetical protein
MLDCPLEQVADGWWLCPQCGWLYYGPVFPHRNCPEARARVIAEIDRLLALRETPETDAEIDRLADRLTCHELRRRPVGCRKKRVDAPT